MMEPSSKEGSSSGTPATVGQLVTNSLGTLLEDSRTLRELSNIREALILSNDDDSYSNNLHHLRAKVASLEEKLNLLREVVREEQMVLDDLEALDEQVQKRNCLLRALIDEQKQANGVNTNQNLDALTSLGAPQRVPIPEAAFQQLVGKMPPSPATTKHGRIHLQRIKQSELDSVPRTSRGRIALSLLNEALMEIEQVLIQKFGSSSSMSARKNSTRRNKWQHDVLTEDDKSNIGDRLWVTEQELRSSCPFFRHGESTARATLLLLRTLHRLQQVPRKQPDFLYVVELSAS